MNQVPKHSLRRPSPHSGKFLSGADDNSAPGSGTYRKTCMQGMQTIAQALELPPLTDELEGIVDTLMQGWGDQVIPRSAPYASNIGDDHSPFEYSLAFDPEGPELRLLIEAQATPPSSVGNHAAALALNRRLQSKYAVDLRRFDAVQELFLGTTGEAVFSLWHAMSLEPGASPAFKLYLNPQSQGKARAFPIIEETLRRLGFAQAAVDCVRRVMPRSGLDELSYFSLDMSSKPQARVKVYVAHPVMSPQELDHVFRVCPSHRAGDVLAFCEAMAPGLRRFEAKPLMSCLSFVSGSELPSAVTLHLPIAHYVASDRITCDRVSAFLRAQGLDHRGYERSLTAVARRPLDEGVGVQSYASFRREAGALRFTAYLSPELFS